MLAAATMAASAADGEAARLPRVCSTSSTLWRSACCSTPGRTADRHAAPSMMLWLQTSPELPACSTAFDQHTCLFVNSARVPERLQHKQHVPLASMQMLVVGLHSYHGAAQHAASAVRNLQALKASTGIQCRSGQQGLPAGGGASACWS